MDNNELIELLGKKKLGNITLLEQKHLQEILAESEDATNIADVVNQLYTLPIYEKLDDSRLWQNIHTAIQPPTNPKRPSTRRMQWLKYTAVAACLAMVIALSVYYLYTTASGSKQQNIVATKPGSRTNLVLPDGSKVWLNADSRITYNDEFGKGKRELTLTGEAYFDVVKDASHPFIIHTQVMDVKVLGTAFNVRAYPNEKVTETALYRGLVQIILNKNKEQKILLQPNEKIAVQNAYNAPDVCSPATIINNTAIASVPLVSITSIVKVGVDSLDIESQWVKNRLAFTRKSLEDVAVQVSRWFGVTVTIADASLKTKEYSGLFGDQNLQQVMESLKLAGGFNYIIENNAVIIMP